MKECQRPVLIAADFVGSTSTLLRFTETDTPILRILELSIGSFLLGDENNKNELIRGKPAGIKKVNAQFKC